MKRALVVLSVAFATLLVVAVSVFAWAFYLGDWRLSRAEQRWQDANIEAYTMDVSFSCRCVMSGDWSVMVDGDNVELDARGEWPPGLDSPTIDGLYAMARDVMNEPSDSWPGPRVMVNAKIDGNGVPLDVYIDRMSSDDEELGWTIVNFEAR